MYLSPMIDNETQSYGRSKKCNKPTNKWMEKPKTICPTICFKLGCITMTQIQQNVCQE